MTLAVVIATKGRPDVLAETLVSLASQTLLPEQVVLSATCVDDLPTTMPSSLHVDVVFGPAGSSVQRNAARSYLSLKTDLVCFLDDDIELAADYLEQVTKAFYVHREVGLLDGAILANGDGVTRSKAKKLLACDPVQGPPALLSRRSLYGCNMCVRADIFRMVAFDENLRLYAWLEDFDWSVRAGKYGAIMSSPAARAVHLRSNTGRISGRKFGYAQVMNPYYLYKKGTIPQISEVLLRHWFRSLLANLVGVVCRDPNVDRWGRLRGNIRAYVEIFRGRSDPKLIELI